MKVTHHANDTFGLVAEDDTDLDLVGAIFFHNHLAIEARLDEPCANGSRRIVGAVLRVDAASPQALRAQAGQEALRALGQLFRLGAAEAAGNGHVVPNATNPQTKETLAPIVDQLELVLKTLRAQIGQGQTQGSIEAHATSIGASLAAGGAA